MVLQSGNFRSIVNLCVLTVGAVFFAGSAQARTVKKAAVKAAVQLSVIKPVMLNSVQSEILAAHNQERAIQQQPPLQWDAALASDAATWAKQLALSNRFEHAHTQLAKNGQGENLWMGTRGAYPVSAMVGMWIDERQDTKSGKFPDVSKTGQWSDVGHYIQLVWPETQKLGCAIEANSADEILVCRYWPAGNRIGDEFKLHNDK